MSQLGGHRDVENYQEAGFGRRMSPAGTIVSILSLVVLSGPAPPPDRAEAVTAEWAHDFKEVSPPFYITYIENPEETALFRCPDGPAEGCSLDDLPGPQVIAAGADARYVVIGRVPRNADDNRRPQIQYFYFARIAQESRGWGANPEHIVGPLTEDEFRRAKRELGLPDFTVNVP